MIPSLLLKNIGLSDNETKVYLALLNFKKGSVTKIAEEAQVNRTTAYDVLNYLNKKGLVVKYIENTKAGFMVNTPKRLKSWLTQESQYAETRKKMLSKHFSDLEYLFKATPEAPRIKYFEGEKQLKTFFNDILEANPEESIGYASCSLIYERVNKYSLEERYIRYYARERFNRNITGRYIVQEADKENIIQYFQKYYGKYIEKNPRLIQIKILPTKQKRHFLNETNIYGNKFSISHLGEHFFGVIIESEDVANTQRIIFQSLWSMLKEKITL